MGKFMFLALACSALAALLISGCAQNAAPPAAEEETGRRGPIRVGQVEMEILLHSYAKAGDFFRKAEEIQVRFEELQEDDFEQMMQLQEEFQIAQMEFFRKFREDIGKTAERAVTDLNLDMVAVEVLFGAEQTEIIDLTEYFMETDLFSGQDLMD